MVKPISFNYNGEIFNSILELSKRFGIHQSTIGRRLRDGWSLEQALNQEAKPKQSGNAPSVNYNGKIYKNLKELAEINGIDPKTFRARLHRGSSLDEAITGIFKRNVSKNSKKISHKDKTYNSIKDLASEYRIKPSVFSRRVKNGWTVDQALEIVDAPPRFRNFEGHARNIKWKHTRSESSLIEPIPDSGGYKLYLIKNTKNTKEYVGITIGSISTRLKQHFSAARRGRKSPLPNAIRFYGEDSFFIELIRNDAKTFDELQDQEINEIAARGTLKNGYNAAVGGALGTSKSITVDGKLFPSLSQAADHFGIDQYVFSMRLNRLKWTPEESAGLIERNWKGKARNIEIDNQSFESLAEAAKFYKIDPKKLYDRLSKGWSVKAALGIDSAPDTTKYIGTSIVVQGVEYKSIQAAASALGISSEPFRLRLKSGMSPDDAYDRARKK